MAAATVVGRCRFAGSGTAVVIQAVGDVVPEIQVHLLAEHGWVGVAETVNRLFGIANEHVEVAARQTLLQQSLEILILLGTGVLELINHEMGYRGAHTLIHKG